VQSHAPRDLHAYGIDLFLHQQGLDTTTPSGRMMFQMLGVFAEFERAMIRERVKSGLERARAQGKTLGRPPIEAKKEAAIRADLRLGKAGIMKLAATYGVGVGTVQHQGGVDELRRADGGQFAPTALEES
jgi:DNA invertase Pin-like site-specific DNA recombinase